MRPTLDDALAASFVAGLERLLDSTARLETSAERPRAGAAVKDAAQDGEGSYHVFWGAMAYGAWCFVRALYFSLFPQALVRRILNSES